MRPPPTLIPIANVEEQQLRQCSSDATTSPSHIYPISSNRPVDRQPGAQPSLRIRDRVVTMHILVRDITGNIISHHINISSPLLLLGSILYSKSLSPSLS